MSNGEKTYESGGNIIEKLVNVHFFLFLPKIGKFTNFLIFTQNLTKSMAVNYRTARFKNLNIVGIPTFPFT
jgi:hypothetical protein